MAPALHGVSSEVGPLATVMLHRPGGELRRLTPRNNDELLFDGVPWVARAQQEHDAFADALRARGVEVLYVRDSARAGARRGGGPRAGCWRPRSTRSGSGRRSPRRWASGSPR